ncbi:MAG: hypothetical protein QOF74_8780, partial [Caballeronia mineralivorans]|nr:hypothetical protein [Caballeronia mineralivorans]
MFGKITISVAIEMVHLKIADSVRPALGLFHNMTNTPGSTLCDLLRAVRTALSGCWRGHVRWRDEEIEIALSRSPFSGRGHQLRCALVFPLS